MPSHRYGKRSERPRYRRIKFVICGNLRFIDQMRMIAKGLRSFGHRIVLPVKVQGTDYENKSPMQGAENIRRYDLIRKHFDEIRGADAILVVNGHKLGGSWHHIGGNTFLEMGFAHVLDKEIFVLRPLPNNAPYYEEMLGMNPTILYGKWDRINELDFLRRDYGEVRVGSVL